ncbi:MAG TPA: M1 family metallopeptidase, partial [Bacteroidales bacterium]|nr:M1 family metallopeptidase [Bacteroidales bacterium]
KVITVVMKAFWVNRSGDIVPNIRMHMYMNAFRNSRSTMNVELAEFRGLQTSDYGEIDIKTFTDDSGNDLIPSMKYISPDDGNLYDQTVLDIMLPKPARPGDTVFVNINFETKLPYLTRRTGYSDDFFFVGQWFPKFGVYEEAGMRYAIKGNWNCHQFHANSEFFSNHSLYNVRITVPQKYIVGTCGMLITESDSVDNGKNKTLTYRAEDIVDFAWTAWPGYTVYTDHWKSLKITLLIPGERASQVKRQFDAAKNALEYFDKYVGPYPWPYLTIVDPPSKGARSGGMEYTTMFTSLSSYIIPEFIHFPEMVTIHEFGHAYFMGIMASNEFEEPWLDEGVNSFWQGRIVDHYYGENSGMINHPFLKMSDKTLLRNSYVHGEGREDVSNNEYSWNYPDGTYGMMSYDKTATWLYTLMGIVDEETTNQIFREYYKRWAFKYPSGKDFVNTVNDVVTKIHGNKFGPDMNWFFSQTLYGTGLCDYKVSGISNKPDTLMGSQKVYISVAELERTGEVMLPVDILIHFDNGDSIKESWDGKSRFKNFRYTGTRKIDWVKIDPDYKITMDINYNNNSMTVNFDDKPLRKFANKLILFFQFFISFISL